MEVFIMPVIDMSLNDLREYKGITPCPAVINFYLSAICKLTYGGKKCIIISINLF